VGRGPILLPDVLSTPCHTIHPGFDDLIHHLEVHLSVHLQPSLEEVGGMMLPSLETFPKTMTMAGNFIFIMMGTSKGSLNSQQWFLELTF